MAQISNAIQGSEEWQLDRIGKATASRFNDILAFTRNGFGAARKNYAAELVAEILTGVRSDNYKSKSMEWGTETEPVARLQYQLVTGNEVEETGFWSHDTLPAGASPDGLVNHDGILEIKCPNTATHIETLTTQQIPKQYIPQVQGQLWITEKLWCDFVSYDPRLPENAQLVVIRVSRDEQYILELQEKVEEFMLDVQKQVRLIQRYKG